MKRQLAVLGNGGGIGEALLDQLVGSSTEVIFLDENSRAVSRATDMDLDIDARIADPGEATALDRENVHDVDVAVVVSRKDERNFLVGQLLGLRRATRVIALVNDPDNLKAFIEAGIEPVCVSTALAATLDEVQREQDATDTESEVSSARYEANEDDEPQERIPDERVRSDGGTRSDERGCD